MRIAIVEDHPAERELIATMCGGLGEHLVQSLRGFEALGVHLVDVLGAGRTGGEPVVLGGDLQTADLGVVARSLGGSVRGIPGPDRTCPKRRC